MKTYSGNSNDPSKGGVNSNAIKWWTRLFVKAKTHLIVCVCELSAKTKLIERTTPLECPYVTIIHVG